jgi:hypothetical protein
MGFSAIDQLIAKGSPSPITSALQGFQQGAQMMPGLQKQKLGNQLLQAQISKLQRPNPIQGSFAQNIAGILQIAKQRGLNPVQTSQVLDQFQQSQQKKGISMGFGQGGGLSSLQIGGTAGGVGGGGIPGVGILSPSAIVPNSGQTSRGSMGATKVNPATGEITSIPTRATGGFLQSGVVGNEKFQDGLKTYKKGMLPYIGVNGHANYGLDLALAQSPKEIAGIPVPGIKAAAKRIGDYRAAKSLRIGLATDAARMAAGGTPGTTEINKWFDAIHPSFFDTQDIFNRQMIGLSKQGNRWAQKSKTGLKTGVSVGQLSPEELQAMQHAEMVSKLQPTLGQTLFPDDEHVAALHALKQPQHLVNGVPHLKPAQTAALKKPQAQVQPKRNIKDLSDDELRQIIARGGK